MKQNKLMNFIEAVYNVDDCSVVEIQQMLQESGVNYVQMTKQIKALIKKRIKDFNNLKN